MVPLLGSTQQAVPEAYKRVNDALVSELAQLFCDLRDSGKLRADLDTDYAAFLFNDYGHVQLLRLCSQAPLDLQRHQAEVRGFTAFVLRGMVG